MPPPEPGWVPPGVTDPPPDDADHPITEPGPPPKRKMRSARQSMPH